MAVTTVTAAPAAATAATPATTPAPDGAGLPRVSRAGIGLPALAILPAEGAVTPRHAAANKDLASRFKMD